MSLPKGLDLRSLEIFLAVAETRSMTKAAERLGMTQSAISQQIQQIESRIGTCLVDRQLRPLGITPAGLVLRQRAAQLLVLAEETWIEISQAGKALLPALRLLVQPSLARTLVPELALSLMSEIPVRHLSVSSGFAHEQALLSREVDMLVSTNALYDVDGLERYELVSEPYVVLLPIDLKDEGGDLEALAERLPLVRYSERSPAGRQIESYLRWLRIRIPRTVEFDSVESVTALVAAGKGWAITSPSMLLHGFPGTGAVRGVPLPGPGLRRRITLVARAGELNDLPRVSARLCSKVLKHSFMMSLRDKVPEFFEQIQFGRVD